MQTEAMEPTPLEIRPAPPEPTRLNRRAGFAALLVLGLLLGAIVYGVATRQGASLRMSEQERGAESATSAGKEIASRLALPTKTVPIQVKHHASDIFVARGIKQVGGVLAVMVTVDAPPASEKVVGEAAMVRSDL